MVFAFTIEGRHPSLPANKRYDEGNRLEEVWGTYVNNSSSTGGEIDPECDNIAFANATDEDAATAIRVQTEVASPGKFTITTAADSSGRWWAKVITRGH